MTFTKYKTTILVAVTVVAILIFAFYYQLLNKFDDIFQHVVPSLKTVSDSKQPRFVFIDLGANRADTLRVFLKEKNTKFHYDFPKPKRKEYKDAEIFLFEANPLFNSDLVMAKEIFNDVKITIFPSTMVYIEV